MNDLIPRLEQVPGPSRELDAAPFAHRIEMGNGEECWLWQGGLDHRRRGRIWVGKRIMLAHRAVWEFLEGPIPEGQMVCHHCDNPQCVNPGHLYLGSHADNMRDVRQRQRTDLKACGRGGTTSGKRNNWTKGARNPKARLTEEDARQIKYSRAPTQELAAQFDVSYTTIQRIRRGHSWQHVDRALKAHEAQKESAHG